MVDKEEPREVPIHIDASDRLGESVVVFIIMFMVGNTIRTIFGSEENGMAMAFVLGVGSGIYYFKLSQGKPDGFLLHRIATLLPVRVNGLISSAVKRIRR